MGRKFLTFVATEAAKAMDFPVFARVASNRNFRGKCGVSISKPKQKVKRTDVANLTG